jgi:hypothetical protein
MPTLNSKVFVVKSYGVKEEATVRDVLTLGQGKAFEGLKVMDCFQTLLADLQNEKNKPREVLTENLRVARKVMEKARWWLNTGVYMLTPTEKEVLEAQEEYRQAYTKWQKAYELSEATGKQF